MSGSVPAEIRDFKAPDPDSTLVDAKVFEGLDEDDADWGELIKALDLKAPEVDSTVADPSTKTSWTGASSPRPSTR